MDAWKRLLHRWWNRPAGGRDVMILALPLIISTSSWTVMNFIDRMFLLWYSSDAMAASLPAGLLHFTVVCFPLGIASYVNTFVAQYHGADRRERIGPIVWQGILLSLMAAPFILMTIPAASHIFAWAGHDPEIARLEASYYRIVGLAGGAEVMAGAMAAFFTGRGATRTVMVVDILAAIINIVLDYAWIFGRWGFPECGIEGAAWATVVALCSRVVIYGFLMFRPGMLKEYPSLRRWRFDRPLFRRLLRFGGPNGLQFLIEVTGFTLFLLLIGRLGRDAAAATTLAFNINTLAFVPMLGLSMAVATLVGQYLGRNRPDLAAVSAWTSFAMAAGYMGFVATLYVFTPDLLLLGHAAGASAEDFARIHDTTVLLLRFVAAYSLLDSMNLIFSGVCKGAGDTRYILRVNSIVAPIPVAAGWLGITLFDWGLLWCWCAVTAWVCTLGIAFFARFLQGSWRTMRVIESAAEDLGDGPGVPPSGTSTTDDNPAPPCVAPEGSARCN